MKPLLTAVYCLVVLCHRSIAETPQTFVHQQMTGEVTTRDAIVQARLAATEDLVDGDLPGSSGGGRFEYSEHADFRAAQTTGWLDAQPRDDYIIKTRLTDLQPATQYFYRLHYGPDANSVRSGPSYTFRTLPGANAASPISLAVVTGMNYPSFYKGPRRSGQRDPKLAYHGADRSLGYPALASIQRLKPDFFVGTGDNVYYDSKDDEQAETIHGMRRKWHEQFLQPRFRSLFRDVPTYWEKDDHDHRYNDCDRIGDRPPASDLGIRIFREQVAIVDPLDPTAPTYRTHRINRHLQIWLVEGRDYRSPNRQPDGPDKTLWGEVQLGWLRDTLSASDATFKLLISPTPLVGPDDAYKIDNHANHQGFRHEGRAFLSWIKQQQLDQHGFYIICGDRHWQYHSINPTGIEEFSCGALCDSNSRIGRSPGDPKSTDPQATIQQPYSQTEASGGFLRVFISQYGTASFEFYDELGSLLYRCVKRPVGRQAIE